MQQLLPIQQNFLRQQDDEREGEKLLPTQQIKNFSCYANLQTIGVFSVIPPLNE